MQTIYPEFSFRLVRSDMGRVFRARSGVSRYNMVKKRRQSPIEGMRRERENE
jgi:hypothetical protein